MKQTVTVILILFCLASCTRTIKSRIDAKMKYMNCQTDTCIIRMTDLFSFDWDTMFIFHPNSDYRPQYNNYQDIARRIVFVKGSKIMYMEDEIAIEEPYSFYILSKDIFYKYGTERRNLSDTFLTPETAVFSVKLDESQDCYYLTSISNAKKDNVQ